MEAAKATETDRQLERRIRRALKARRGEATLADVVVDTGIPTIEAERMLRQMIGNYECHLDVTDDGDLLYHFDPALRRYDQSERLQRFTKKIGRPLWRGFVKFMKALIAIVMVVYVVLFVVLIIAAMVASQRGNDSSSDNRMPGRSGGNGGMFWFWYFMFGRPNDRYRRGRYHNPSYRRFDNGRQNKDKRPFYLKVYSFVLGPEPGDVEPELDETALLAYVREKRGAVTTAEVASRTGWSLARAERGLTRMVAEYDGNIAVTDDGDLVFTFADLLSTLGGKKEAAPAPPFWKRWETKMPLTGNESGTNVLVTGFSLFNFFAALAAPSMILPQLGWEPTSTLLFGLSWFPIGFSAAMLTIPLLRLALWVRPENRRRRARNLRRTAYHQAFKAARKTSDPTLIPERVTARALDEIPQRAYAPNVNEKDVERALHATLEDLDGEPDSDEDGENIVYRYERLANAYTAGRQVRRAMREDADQPFKVVFSSQADELDEADTSEQDDASEQEEDEEAEEARVLH